MTLRQLTALELAFDTWLLDGGQVSKFCLIALQVVTMPFARAKLLTPAEWAKLVQGSVAEHLVRAHFFDKCSIVHSNSGCYLNVSCSSSSGKSFSRLCISHGAVLMTGPHTLLHHESTTTARRLSSLPLPETLPVQQHLCRQAMRHPQRSQD